jgi:hypothetical protein
MLATLQDDASHLLLQILMSSAYSSLLFQYYSNPVTEYEVTAAPSLPAIPASSPGPKSLRESRCAGRPLSSWESSGCGAACSRSSPPATAGGIASVPTAVCFPGEGESDALGKLVVCAFSTSCRRKPSTVGICCSTSSSKLLSADSEFSFVLLASVQSCHAEPGLHLCDYNLPHTLSPPTEPIIPARLLAQPGWVHYVVGSSSPVRVGVGNLRPCDHTGLRKRLPSLNGRRGGVSCGGPVDVRQICGRCITCEFWLLLVDSEHGGKHVAKADERFQDDLLRAGSDADPEIVSIHLSDGHGEGGR